MDIKNDSDMIVYDSEGKEHLMQILFTYENKERGHSYIFFFDKEDKNGVVNVSIYTDDGKLLGIEDDEEYDELEEVFDAWQNDPKIQKCKN